MHDEMTNDSNIGNSSMGLTGNGTATNGNTAEEANTEPTQHVFYEVGGDLFSKPNALGDILEAEGIPPALIFCNTPSDVDLVDVLLKKRGIVSLKLVGHVPPQKTQRSLKQLRTGELQAIVATDVASADLDNDTADFVVNYAMPTDPELYIHRSCHGAPGRRPKKVVSLVGPLDIAHFHYVKKFADCEFVKADLPSRERMTELRIEQLAKEAAIGGVAGDERIQSFVQAVLRSKDRESVIALLLRNTIDVLPSLMSAAGGGEARNDRSGDDNRGDDRRHDDRRGDDRRSFDRRDRRGGGRDGERGGRGRRNDRRGDGGRNDGPRNDGGRNENGGGFNDYESQATFIQRGAIEQPPREDFGDNEGGESAPGGRDSRRNDSRNRGGDFRDRGDSRGRDSRRDSRDNGDDRRREPREELPPMERECRVYLGHGTTQGFTEAKFVDLLQQSGTMTPETLKRFRIREHYSFADFPQEMADQVVEKLGNSDFEGGKLFVRKAIMLGSPREMNGGRDNDRFRSDNNERDDGDNQDGFTEQNGSHDEDRRRNDRPESGAADIAANDAGPGPTYLDEEDMP